MKPNTEKSADELEKEWQGISERLKEIRLPGFEKTKFDLTSYDLLRQLIRYDIRLAAEVRNRIPELLSHPLFTYPTTELETFSVASPQAGPDKSLRISHASYLDAGVSYHFDSGIAVFHSELMGNLGTEYPSVALEYLFPDDDSAIWYNVRFKLFLYNLTDRQGADFRSDRYEWWREDTAVHTYPHIALSEDGGYRYINIRVRASTVNGKKFVFRINHLDWLGSHVNWWFYSVKVTRTGFTF